LLASPIAGGSCVPSGPAPRGSFFVGRGFNPAITDGRLPYFLCDDADRLTSVTDAATNVTHYAYDTENNLLTITDANNHATTFAYAAFGRVTQSTFPSNLFETYGYDAADNLTSKTHRKNQTIQYVYDALNRLSQKSYPNSTNVNYIYDLASKIAQANDPAGTYGFSYDNMGRLTVARHLHSQRPIRQSCSPTARFILAIFKTTANITPS
jgi:YD repeat-containing protein